MELPRVGVLSRGFVGELFAVGLSLSLVPPDGALGGDAAGVGAVGVTCFAVLEVAGGAVGGFAAGVLAPLGFAFEDFPGVPGLDEGRSFPGGAAD